MLKRMVLLLMVLLIFGGCAGSKEAKTRTHKFLEHAGIDWFNF